MLGHSLTLSLLALGVTGLPTARDAAECAAVASWPGWEGIKHVFTFGDSYSQTGFNWTLTPPSPGNPLGNPAYPGWTSANGPNWVDYLTVKYNDSLLQTYNLADGGATVDSDLVAPWRPEVRSLKYQVHTDFVTAYTTSSSGGGGREPPQAPGAPGWTGADSVFAVWIGINDVGNSYYHGPGVTDELYARLLAGYRGALDALWAAGARHFVLLTVPPVDRSPLMLGQDAAARALERAALAQWNGRVAALAAALRAAHPGEAAVWVYDADAAFAAVLDAPAARPETAGYRNTTAFCAAYENGTPAWDTFTPSCGVPVNEYFWLNSLHPTYPMHEVVAREVAEQLRQGPTAC